MATPTNTPPKSYAYSCPSIIRHPRSSLAVELVAHSHEGHTTWLARETHPAALLPFGETSNAMKSCLMDVGRWPPEASVALPDVQIVSICLARVALVTPR